MFLLESNDVGVLPINGCHLMVDPLQQLSLINPFAKVPRQPKGITLVKVLRVCADHGCFHWCRPSPENVTIQRRSREFSGTFRALEEIALDTNCSYCTAPEGVIGAFCDVTQSSQVCHAVVTLRSD